MTFDRPRGQSVERLRVQFAEELRVSEGINFIFQHRAYLYS
jgi:hypothetical protein